MTVKCPRCSVTNPDAARYCRHCGLPLQSEGGQLRGAGRVSHPEPLSWGERGWPIEGAADLYFCWEAVGGGLPLLGTEPLAVSVFNGGFDLVDVTLEISGHDRNGKRLFGVQREIAEWPRGETRELEIPSWELPAPVSTLQVGLVKAAFAEPR